VSQLSDLHQKLVKAEKAVVSTKAVAPVPREKDGGTGKVIPFLGIFPPFSEDWITAEGKGRKETRG